MISKAKLTKNKSQRHELKEMALSVKILALF